MLFLQGDTAPPNTYTTGLQFHFVCKIKTLKAEGANIIHLLDKTKEKASLNRWKEASSKYRPQPPFASK